MADKVCSKIDTCPKIISLRDRDMLEEQFGDAVRSVCNKCKDFTPEKDESSPILQVPLDCIKRDGDGYYLFLLPATVYVQRLDGQPLPPEEGEMEGYIQLTIDIDGSIKTRITR